MLFCDLHALTFYCSWDFVCNIQLSRNEEKPCRTLSKISLYPIRQWFSSAGLCPKNGSQVCCNRDMDRRVNRDCNAQRTKCPTAHRNQSSITESLEWEKAKNCGSAYSWIHLHRVLLVLCDWLLEFLYLIKKPTYGKFAFWSFDGVG